MLDTAESFLSLLKFPGAMDIDSIEYRHGMIIFRKEQV
jgi:hypothetical protein